MSEALVASDVTKRYDETVALADVSLSVTEGEIVALVGPNGAGKTTFVRVLTGTAAPSTGTVELFGQPPGAIDRSQLGVLPQSFAPPGRLSATELLEYYTGLYDEARDPATVLAEVGLADVEDVWYEKLSGGQQRRVCLGAVLVNEPDLVVLDEPTTGIDPAGRRTVREQILGLAEAGATVLLTTHDMAEAERLADRVALLADGELQAVGEPAALIDEHGGESRLFVELDDPVVDLDGSLPAGISVDVTEAGLTLRNVDPTEIGSIVSTLEAEGIEYEALSWRQPELEDVYMALAGEQERLGTDRQRAEGRR